jgi:hypothetical protein
MPGANTLAYFGSPSVTKKKFYNGDDRNTHFTEKLGRRGDSRHDGILDNVTQHIDTQHNDICRSNISIIKKYDIRHNETLCVC